jgi:hypothetical protein
MNCWILLIATAVAISPVQGQTPSEPVDQWEKDKQVYVTKAVRQEVLARSLAEESLGETKPSRLQSVISNWLERFPTIRLVVQPSPPRDYQITINGEPCPPTEKSLYKVPAGTAEVRVIRGAMPPCVWRGQLKDGLTEEVRCNL